MPANELLLGRTRVWAGASAGAMTLWLAAAPALAASPETRPTPSVDSGTLRGPFLHDWQISGAVGSHNVTWPLRIWSPFHFAADAALDTPYFRWRYGHMPLRVRVGGFEDHDFHFYAMLTDLETGHSFDAPFGAFGEVAVSLGYLGGRDDRLAFEQSSGGEWRQTHADWHSALTAGTALSLGYDFSRTLAPARVFVRYRWLVEYPYLAGEIPIMAHGFWSVGAAFRLQGVK
jgi:hypothetical protein